MTCRARLAALALVGASTSCVTNVSLGERTSPLVIAPPISPVACTPGRPIARFATTALGDLRALAASGGELYGAFARSDGEGVVARVDGDHFIEVARVGNDPTALAIDVTIDETTSYVASAATSDVRKISRAGIAIVTAQPHVGAIVVAGHVPLWSRPDSDAVVTADFATGAASVVVQTMHPVALVVADQSLFVASDLAGLSAVNDHTLHRIASACGDHAFAVGPDDVYCGFGSTVFRVGRALGTVQALETAAGNVTDVVVARGRLFFARSSFVWQRPLDDVGGTLLYDVAGGRAMLATDGCDLYFDDGNAIVRRPL